MKRTTPLLALALGLSGLVAPISAQAATTATVVAAQDSHVNALYPHRTFGNSAKLKVEGTKGKVKYAYIKFTVPRKEIESVALRLRPLTTAGRGVTVYRSHGSWRETNLTWKTRPARQGLLGSSNGLVAGSNEVIALNVGALEPGQTIALRLETTATKPVSFVSSEGRANLRPSLLFKTRDSSAPPTFPPATPISPKLIGMSAPAHLWDQRIREVGPNGVTARRIFADLSASGSSQLPLIREAIADGMMPVISYKVPSPTALANGEYDAWLSTLRTQLVALNAPVTATFWHEPHGDMDPAVFRAASLRFFQGVNAPSIAVGPILNGWLLDRRVSDFASYTDANLLAKWEFVAVDSYQSGTPSNPGSSMPARAIPLLETWMDQQGHPDKPLGLGEYNGFSASAIEQAGETILSTPEVWFGLAWNSQGDSYAPLEGDRLAAFKRTKADSRAAQ